MFLRSPSASSGSRSGSVCFSTGSDSPVSAASCTWRLWTSIRRPSPGMRSPAVKRTTSPGTRSRAGSSRSFPSRNTIDLGAAILRSASSERSARNSCTNPKTTANSTMTPIATASTACPSTNDRTTATNRTKIRTFWSCAKKSFHGETRLAACSSLGPTSASLRAASTAVRPCGPESKHVPTSSGARVCAAGSRGFLDQGFIAEEAIGSGAPTREPRSRPRQCSPLGVRIRRRSGLS